MKYLLDTHVFVWMLINPEKLSAKSTSIIIHSKDVSISSVSLWEIAIKYKLGKLNLRDTTPDDLLAKAEEMEIQVLPLKGQEAVSFFRLVSTHKDPFDRMIVWQSIRNNMVLVSKDNRLNEFTQSGLQLIW
jgi:PIN domain nuclease of toxin-antitoxin system